MSVAVAVDVSRAGSTDGVALFMQRAAEGDTVHLSSVAGVIARDDDAGAAISPPLYQYGRKKRKKETRTREYTPQHLLIRITQLLEQRSSGLRRRLLTVHDAVLVEVVSDDISHGLGVCGGTAAAAPYCVVDLGEFVCDSVGDECAGCGAAVCAEDYAVFEVDGHAVCWLVGY